MGGAAVLLLICYFQQKELAKLRKENLIEKEINVLNNTRDSLINKIK